MMMKYIHRTMQGTILVLDKISPTTLNIMRNGMLVNSSKNETDSVNEKEIVGWL